MMVTTFRIHPAAVPDLTDTEIELQATSLRVAYSTATGIAEFPVDADDLILSLLYPRDHLVLDDPCDLGNDQDGERVIGCTVGDYQGGVIRIDQTVVDTPRYPFTVAHELGHWILHRNLLAEAYAYALAHGQDVFGIPTLQRNLTSDRWFNVPKEERQANRFAVHLLMPADEIRREFQKRNGMEPINYRRKCYRVGRFAANYPTLRSYTTCLTSNDKPFDLQSRFKVSKEALAIRIEELGLVVDTPFES